MNDEILIWCGEYGEYVIPEELRDTPVRQDGYPDGRFRARKAELMNWVAEQEAKARDA